MPSGPNSGKRSKTKIGRNDPCFCGSGIKYKRCCLSKGIAPPKTFDEVPQEVLDAFTEAEARRRERQSRGIYINFPGTIEFKGKKLLAVGNRIMSVENPHATFHQLILQNLSSTLGKEWWETESKKTENKRHYIKKCYEELKDSDKRDDLDVTVIDENTRTMLTTGDTQALLSLAFDVYLLTHRGYMSEEWLKRLRHREEYQGVRYEIGVASIFARMGCSIEHYDPKERDASNKQPKRAEFIAIHAETNNRVAVEAKSRQRDGVLHRPGNLNYSRAIRGDISTIYKKALEKETDNLPLIVFIDVNSPIDVNQSVEETQWFKDVQRSFESRPRATAEKPDKHTVLFVTNYSTHYQGASVAPRGQFLAIGSNQPASALSDGWDGRFMHKLTQAVSGYGFVPHDI